MKKKKFFKFKKEIKKNTFLSNNIKKNNLFIFFI